MKFLLIKKGSSLKQLSKSFFARDTIEVAKNLLGKILSVDGFKGRIVETEAYGNDPASHAFKKTERSALMFDTYGHVYVYLIYGMYNCINFTTEKEKAGAVLIRAVEPLNRIPELKQKRNTKKINNLCSGPGKLCQAFGIDRNLNGVRLGREVKLFDDGFIVDKIGESSRIGIKDALDLQWRFFVKDNEFVSKVK
ncbi:MAG: DNA-3-methyladenine glycosylase [Nanoarchaeota archaeon]|nr:DNA-3-methyladenine glycosylase [Nanoarchaeota archaeon]MBU1644618.1 DNA-3-methyladenine glycosylase [Nanoarchaeota archaeon]MBU1977026.1 DNA-3-methyladenine glycosylase [Nanoarchaeota archaeon]